jgi:hypothetical protein
VASAARSHPPHDRQADTANERAEVHKTTHFHSTMNNKHVAVKREAGAHLKVAHGSPSTRACVSCLHWMDCSADCGNVATRLAMAFNVPQPQQRIEGAELCSPSKVDHHSTTHHSQVATSCDLVATRDTQLLILTTLESGP